MTLLLLSSAADILGGGLLIEESAWSLVCFLDFLLAWEEMVRESQYTRLSQDTQDQSQTSTESEPDYLGQKDGLLGGHPQLHLALGQVGGQPHAPRLEKLSIKRYL